MFFSFIFVLFFFHLHKTLKPAQIVCLCVNQCYRNRVYDDNRTIYVTIDCMNRMLQNKKNQKLVKGFSKKKDMSRLYGQSQFRSVCLAAISPLNAFQAPKYSM